MNEATNAVWRLYPLAIALCIAAVLCHRSPCLICLSTCILHRCPSKLFEITDLCDSGMASLNFVNCLRILSGMHLFSVLHGYQVQLPC